MFIYILRHAWAGHFGDPGWPDDSQRPLTEEGIERFKRVVYQLVQRGFAPEVIATSPYVRCRQTADLVAEGVDDAPEVVELPALVPGSNVVEVLDWTCRQDVDQLAWVGHAPDVSYLAGALLGDCSTGMRFAKGACAAIRIEQPITESIGELYWHVTAKVLGC